MAAPTPPLFGEFITITYPDSDGDPQFADFSALEGILARLQPEVQTPMPAMTITGTLADDKMTLPANCVKVMFQISGVASAYVNPADDTPASSVGIPFAAGIPFVMECAGATYLYAEAASGTMNAIAFCTE